MGTVEHIDSEGVFTFWKNLALIVIFITFTPVALATSLFSLYSLNKTETVQEEIVQKTANLIESPKSGVRVYASLPDKPQQVSGEVTVGDARVELVRRYLARYNSPMEHLAGYIVQKADENGLDYRLIVSISQQESNVCKRIPENTYNCWGWGIHSKGTLGFNSFEEGIDTVSKGLKEGYIDKGLVTPEELMTKYVPHSPEGAWAKGVSSFMEDMQ